MNFIKLKLHNVIFTILLSVILTKEYDILISNNYEYRDINIDTFSNIFNTFDEETTFSCEYIDITNQTLVTGKNIIIGTPLELMYYLNNEAFAYNKYLMINYNQSFGHCSTNVDKISMITPVLLYQESKSIEESILCYCIESHFVYTYLDTLLNSTSSARFKNVLYFQTIENSIDHFAKGLACDYLLVNSLQYCLFFDSIGEYSVYHEFEFSTRHSTAFGVSPLLMLANEEIVANRDLKEHLMFSYSSTLQFISTSEDIETLLTLLKTFGPLVDPNTTLQQNVDLILAILITILVVCVSLIFHGFIFLRNTLKPLDMFDPMIYEVLTKTGVSYAIYDVELRSYLENYKHIENSLKPLLWDSRKNEHEKIVQEFADKNSTATDIDEFQMCGEEFYEIVDISDDSNASSMSTLGKTTTPSLLSSHINGLKKIKLYMFQRYYQNELNSNIFVCFVDVNGRKKKNSQLFVAHLVKFLGTFISENMSIHDHVQRLANLFLDVFATGFHQKIKVCFHSGSSVVNNGERKGRRSISSEFSSSDVTEVDTEVTTSWSKNGINYFYFGAEEDNCPYYFEDINEMNVLVAKIGNFGNSFVIKMDDRLERYQLVPIEQKSVQKVLVQDRNIICVQSHEFVRSKNENKERSWYVIIPFQNRGSFFVFWNIELKSSSLKGDDSHDLLNLIATIGKSLKQFKSNQMRLGTPIIGMPNKIDNFLDLSRISETYDGYTFTYLANSGMVETNMFNSNGTSAELEKMILEDFLENFLPETQIRLEAYLMEGTINQNPENTTLIVQTRQGAYQMEFEVERFYDEESGYYFIERLDAMLIPASELQVNHDILTRQFESFKALFYQGYCSLISIDLNKEPYLFYSSGKITEKCSIPSNQWLDLQDVILKLDIPFLLQKKTFIEKKLAEISSKASTDHLPPRIHVSSLYQNILPFDISIVCYLNPLDPTILYVLVLPEDCQNNFNFLTNSLYNIFDSLSIKMNKHMNLQSSLLNQSNQIEGKFVRFTVEKAYELIETLRTLSNWHYSDVIRIDSGVLFENIFKAMNLYFLTTFFPTMDAYNIQLKFNFNTLYHFLSLLIDICSTVDGGLFDVELNEIEKNDSLNVDVIFHILFEAADPFDIPDSHLTIISTTETISRKKLPSFFFKKKQFEIPNASPLLPAHYESDKAAKDVWIKENYVLQHLSFMLEGESQTQKFSFQNPLNGLINIPLYCVLIHKASLSSFQVNFLAYYLEFWKIKYQFWEEQEFDQEKKSDSSILILHIRKSNLTAESVQQLRHDTLFLFEDSFDLLAKDFWSTKIFFWLLAFLSPEELFKGLKKWIEYRF
eukprot:TRINITY_DN1825_c0_g1_i1.p1 TRINITY_DN1825_c0_g1~~TRINITY_DN1825_c0_g1_i1.p1  ORF type:complete len:1322 (+),score=306.57 TRINITY_DN1825_c0_g1_i1:40-4005(+)